MEPVDRATFGAAPGSVTRAIPGLRKCELDAVGIIWERYFQQLVRIAAARMNPARCRAIAPEDLVQEVLLKFPQLVGGAEGARRFPHLESRENVWRILVSLTSRAAFDHNTKEDRRVAVVEGGSALGTVGAAGFPNGEPPPEFASAVNELFALLVDPLDPVHTERLQQVARLVMAGYTYAEIADSLGCGEKSIALKVKLIRRIWRERAGIEELP